MNLRNEIYKPIYFTFGISMFALFCLQSYFCLVKILDPVIVKLSQQRFVDELEFPSLTICRKGLKNVTDIAKGLSAFGLAAGICPDFEINCIQSLIYDQPEDYYVKSTMFKYFADQNKTLKTSFNFYTVYQMAAYNCFVISHSGLIQTGT